MAKLNIEIYGIVKFGYVKISVGFDWNVNFLIICIYVL